MSIVKKIQRAFECDQAEFRSSNRFDSTAKSIKMLIQRNGLKKIVDYRQWGHTSFEQRHRAYDQSVAGSKRHQVSQRMARQLT